MLQGFTKSRIAAYIHKEHRHILLFLLQLRGFEDLPGYSVAGTALSLAIETLDQETNELEAELENEQAIRQGLVRARDLGWETYSTLARKATEVDIASEVQGTEVRLAVPAVEPLSRIYPRVKLNVMLAAIAGLVLATMAAFVIEFLTAVTARQEG